MNAGKMDAGTLRAGTKAVADYMHDRGMLPSNAPQTKGAGNPSTGAFDWNKMPVHQ